MHMTITEKILASHSGRDRVRPGEVITCRVDRLMATDGTAPLAAKVMKEMGAERVHDPDQLILVNDHFQPAKDIMAANLAKEMREFAAAQGVTDFFEVGRGGICHSLIGDLALVLPGQVLIGADSHTCTAGALGAFATGVGATDFAAAMVLGELWLRVPETIQIILTGKLPAYVSGKDVMLRVIRELEVGGARYRALEFTGDAFAHMGMNDRFTLCNMSIEAGGKSGIVPPDALTREYLQSRGRPAGEAVASDPDATYCRTLTIDVAALEPQVAVPYLPSNVQDLGQVEKVKVDQVYIGSCTNGWIEDLEKVARVLTGRTVHPTVRCIIVPATQDIYREALRRGYLQVFADAGAVVSTPTCGACFGGYMGVLTEGEVAVTTTNRNFRGRMGHRESKVYLANPWVAAMTAVTGELADPRELED